MESPDIVLRSQRGSTKIRVEENASTMLLRERYPAPAKNQMNAT